MKEKTSIEITECIKTFEDALAATGRPAVPDFSNVPEDLRAHLESQYKMIVITEAINEGWEPDWDNYGQYKYFPWFEMSPSSFVYGGTYYWLTRARAGCGSRLCFKTSALARYAGEQFIDIWKNIQLK